MGVFAGPEDWWTEGTDKGRTHVATKGVVQDGLVLNLDAGVSNSYSGSGTTWTDLSSSSNNGTIYQASFSDNKFSFDGTDDRVNLSSAFSITNNFSVELWCLPEATHQIDTQATSGTTGTANKKYILGANFVGSPDAGFGISIGTNGVSTYEHSASYMPSLMVYETTITSFTQIVIAYTNKQPSLYINGNFIKTGLTSPRTNVYLLGNLIGYGSYGYYQGQLAILREYDKSLTASEVKQNFNALRGRFGI